LADRRSRFVPIGQLAAAAAYACERATDTDVYFGLGLHQRALAPEQRGVATDVAGIPGCWLDLDLAKPTSKKAYFPSYAGAHAFLATLPLPPTLVIDSGSGLHLYWCFKAFWTFADQGEREQAAALVEGWQRYIIRRAASVGVAVDSTFDLARVLRIAGTVNHKYDRPVLILSADGPRAEPTDFAEWI